jgi:hypothetical protein
MNHSFLVVKDAQQLFSLVNLLAVWFIGSWI